ncbi:MAG: DUF3488 domain-containing protein [Alphaproteobacteria bacterium]|nr:DUF3488 domain-containing protein [Alphaproteobacteria bacterium]
MRLPWPDAIRHSGFMTSFQGRMMLWQIPLILIFSIDPGVFVAGCWLFGYMLLLVRKWWLNTPLLFLALGALVVMQPPPSAEFFVGMLVMILPMSWRPEDGQTIAPVGLTPTIFLVGSVFIFHIQFFILLLIFIWLLGFLMWFSMIYAGWSLKDLRIRWGRLLAVSIGGSSVIVMIFALIPKIDTGAIPSFARAPDKVKLTDKLSAEGFRSLLGDDTVAFRAFPLDGVAKKTPYWRVFTLDLQTERGWSRSRRPKNQFARVEPIEREHRSFDIMSEGHDLNWIPVPGWPVPGAYAVNRVTPYAEVESPRGTIRQATVAAYDHTTGLTKDPRGWTATTILGDEGRIGPWAREQRQRFASDQAFAAFLMDHFRANYTYSTSTGYTEGSSSEALDEFFFEGRDGYCSFFAQSMATALRAVGIPAHVVTGYLGGDWNDFGGYWMIRNNMAHAWVDAYFPETGWQRLDPTAAVAPGLTSGVLRGGAVFQSDDTLTEGQEGDRPGIFTRAAMWADSLNTNITRSIMQFGGSSKGSFKSRITGMDFETLLWILGGLMTSIVVVSGTTASIRRMGYFNAKPGLRLEARFIDMLSAAKTPRQGGEGLIHYAQRIAQQIAGRDDDALPLPLHDLATRISRARFGGDEMTPAMVRGLNQDIKSMGQALKAAISGNTP